MATFKTGLDLLRPRIRQMNRVEVRGRDVASVHKERRRYGEGGGCRCA